MKKKNYLIVIVAILSVTFLGLNLTACGGDDDTDTTPKFELKEKLIGQWIEVEWKGTDGKWHTFVDGEKNNAPRTTYTFNADGTYSRVKSYYIGEKHYEPKDEGRYELKPKSYDDESGIGDLNFLYKDGSIDYIYSGTIWFKDNYTRFRYKRETIYLKVK